MDKKTAKIIVEKLSKVFTDKPALNYSTPYELLIAVILSAQCTDERVNKITKVLFENYSTPEKMITLSQEQLEKYILVTINSYSVYFSKDSVYKATESNGEEINADDKFIGTTNFYFLIEPGEGYFVKSVTLENESGVDRSSLLELTGTSIRRTVNISAITENLKVNIE